MGARFVGWVVGAEMRGAGDGLRSLAPVVTDADMARVGRWALTAWTEGRKGMPGASQSRVRSQCLSPQGGVLPGTCRHGTMGPTNGPRPGVGRQRSAVVGVTARAADQPAGPRACRTRTRSSCPEPLQLLVCQRAFAAAPAKPSRRVQARPVPLKTSGRSSSQPVRWVGPWGWPRGTPPGRPRPARGRRAVGIRRGQGVGPA
jgi:hypothetical protein